MNKAFAIVDDSNRKYIRKIVTGYSYRFSHDGVPKLYSNEKKARNEMENIQKAVDFKLRVVELIFSQQEL